MSSARTGSIINNSNNKVAAALIAPNGPMPDGNLVVAALVQKIFLVMAATSLISSASFLAVAIRVVGKGNNALIVGRTTRLRLRFHWKMLFMALPNKLL